MPYPYGVSNAACQPDDPAIAVAVTITLFALTFFLLLLAYNAVRGR